MLSGEDTPTLDPLTDAGSGSVREKEKVWLSEIIGQLKTLFDSDTTEEDRLAYDTAAAEKTLESEFLQKQAANNPDRNTIGSSIPMTEIVRIASMQS